ncbi:hypothetical protein KKH35_03170 [Patescibacteria group bacterium]|nr:hypothetical protein [Patescibacteria group bacterium]
MIALKFIFGLMITVITIGLMIVTASIIQKKKEKEKEIDKEKKTDEWWWKFFKPYFCLPIAWGLLHVIFALFCPSIFYYTFTNLLNIVIITEITIFVLNTIVNKNIDFEKRFSRKALLYTYVIIFIITIGLIPNKVLYGEKYAKWDRKLYIKMTASQVELLGEKTNQASESHLIKKKMAALEKLNDKAKKRTLTPNELKKVKDLVAEIKKIPVWKKEIAESINSPGRQTTTTSLLVSLPSPSCPGTLTVPAGQGLHKTSVIVNKGERIWLDANPKAILLDCETGRKIKIPLEGILLPPTGKEGTLFFVKQLKSSSVNYRIGI